MAASQPSATLAPQSSTRVPFTKFTVTAGASDVVINGITVERTGLAADAVFAGLILFYHYFMDRSWPGKEKLMDRVGSPDMVFLKELFLEFLIF